MPNDAGRTASDLKWPLFWLGLVLPVCFIPGTIGATIPTQWIVLSVVLPLAMWRSAVLTLEHACGALFLLWAAFSVAWSPNPMFAVYGLWQVSILALAFWLGSTMVSLSSLWRGLAIGLGLSSAVAVAQAIGFDRLAAYDASRPAGLLFNPAVQGAMIALVAVALVAERSWFYIVPMLPGLWLAHSRGAILVLCVGLLARLHWIAAAGALLIAAAMAAVLHAPSDVERLQVWSVAAGHLALMGYGPGSFMQLVYQTADGVVLYPEHVHNDYLQFVFEYGIGSLPLFMVLIAALQRTNDPHWPVFFAFCTLGLFWFAFYSQPLAFVGGVLAGHLVRSADGVRVTGRDRRHDLISWASPSRPDDAWIGVQAVSVSPRNSTATTGAVDAAL